MNESTLSTQGLASLLEGRLMEWEQARKPQEMKLLECYQDVMRIPRESDTKDTGAARTKKNTGLFMGSTRNKVRSARAKINDALFGNGQLPFDTEPTNEKLAPFADVVEDILTDQLERMKFRDMLKAGTNTLATYGTGFVFGPFVRKEKLHETDADTSAGVLQIVEREYEFDCPYYELGNTLDVYPDPEARNVHQGLGTFWVTMESPHTVRSWKSDDSYSNITEALQGVGGNGTETGSEIAGQLRGNVEYWFKNDRIKVARYFGKVPKSMLPPEAPEIEISNETEDEGVNDANDNAGETEDAIVIMAGGVVVKVSRSPYNRFPVKRAAYEEVEHEMWGVGVAENNAPHQKVTNAAFRLFMEGKGMALLGTKAVDRSKFLPTEDFKKYPGKVYQFKSGLTPDEKKSSIIEFTEPDVTTGWLDVIRMSEQFSDDDTGITKYTQGDDSSNLNKTATGISMIMSASSMPIKEVIQHVDEQWIEPMIEDLIEWNLKYLEPETVFKIHGEEAAKAWAQIKQFGKTSFMTWKATGTASFMQKEVLTSKLRAFADFALSNPNTAPLIDPRELLEQTWSVMEIGRESPILKDVDEEKIPPQVKQEMEKMQAMVKDLDAVVQDLTTKAESKDVERDKVRIEAFKANTDRMKVEGDLTLKAQSQAVDPVALMALIEEQGRAQQQMMLDIMGKMGMLPPQMEQPAEQAEPMPEQAEPPGIPEPGMMEAPPVEMQPPEGGFFTPEAPEQQ